MKLARRTFLRSTGIALALPLLDAMLPARGRAAEEPTPIRRLVCINTTLGIHAENLFPEQAGREYTATPYLDVLKEFRGDLTVLSGLSHPDVDGGHSSEASYLTAAAHPGSSSFKNSISLDQFAVERLPRETRFPPLVLTTSDGGPGLSFTRAGVAIPADGRPSQLFKKLFVAGTAKEVAAEVERLQAGRSIMDAVLADAQRLQKRLGPRDRRQLDEYFSSVREVEERLVASEAWAHKPKPVVEREPPTDVPNQSDFVARSRLMFDLAHLALATDSARIVTLKISGHNSVPPIDGVSQDWHNLSHHGKDPEKLAQLRIIEEEQMKLLAGFLGKLRGSAEGGNNLLAQTQVLYGSNLGNASSHDTKNMPMVLAGGGFRHGQHLAFDRQKNTPLCQVFVAMLRRLSLDVDQFASGKGTLPGLEMA
jgi:hypothetical protein